MRQENARAARWFVSSCTQEIALRKWWILFAAGAVVVGCAGGSLDNGTTGGTGGTGGTGSNGQTRQVPQVNLGTDEANVRILFLTGQQRRIVGSQFARLDFIRLANSDLDQVPTEFSGSTAGIDIQLNGHTVNQYQFSVATNGLPRVYNELRWEVRLMRERQINGIVELANSARSLPHVPVTVPIVPGRTTTLQVFINDAALFWDSFLNTQFDQTFFNEDNELTAPGSTIRGSLSDMVAFDISGAEASSRPQMASGTPATRLLLSGDAIGIAAGNNALGTFDLFSPNFVESGSLNLPAPLGPGDPGATNLPGSYTVIEPNPSSFPDASTIISALQGSWRDSSEVLSNLGDAAMIVFPTTNPNGQHQVVALTRSGGTITNLWIGRVTLAGSTGNVTLWSADQLDNGTENGAVTGTLTNFTIRGGVIRDGDYSLSGSLPGFPASGTFAVFTR